MNSRSFPHTIFLPPNPLSPHMIKNLSDFELNPRVWVPFRSFSNCQKVWLVLFLIFQAMLNEASRVLYNAMDEKVYFSDAIVVVPPDWSNSKCKEQIQTPMSDLVFRVRLLQFKTMYYLYRYATAIIPSPSRIFHNILVLVVPKKIQ